MIHSTTNEAIMRHIAPYSEGTLLGILMGSRQANFMVMLGIQN